jgi:RNA polymerase sigma factor FliA
VVNLQVNVEDVLDQYIPLVHMVVAKMKKGLSDQADEDELLSYGMTGLWDAAQKFDSAQGVKFETYAVQRIRGEILDGLRQTDHASRTLRKKDKMIKQAMEALEQANLRKPTAQEVSLYLGITLEEYEQIQMQLSFIKQDSLNEPIEGDESSQKSYLQLEDHYQVKQEEWVEAKERKKQLASLIDILPEREKLILALIYFENLSLTNVSKVLDVHKSRISQLHQQALKRLRVASEKHGLEW